MRITRAAAIAANLLLEEERGDLVARAEACFGPLDVLVNNAAMGAWALPSQSALAERRKGDISQDALRADGIARMLESLDYPCARAALKSWKYSPGWLVSRFMGSRKRSSWR